MDHKTTLPFFSLRSQSSLGCCQIKLCIVASWVVSTKLSLPSSFKIVSSRMASKTRARAPSISCLLCDGLVAYTRADRQRWPFQLMCLENVIGAISNVLQYAGLTATCKLSMERQQTSPICWQDAWWARWGQHIEKQIFNDSKHISDSNLQTSMFWRRRREMLFPPSLKRGKRAKLMLSLWRRWKIWCIFQINF